MEDRSANASSASGSICKPCGARPREVPDSGSLKIKGIEWNQYQMIWLELLIGDYPLALNPKHGLVQKLLEETGITEAQALELIALLGSNWSSLVREAKAIRDSLKPPGVPPTA
ncbi:hypothetical protein [Mesorhizobium sp. GbtcB19]|uniref:hypothetical protein n=1 Tax=Mesorhizobium sp. GbtcB19 TaxID=2824764 RepID=UPI001C304BB4|nr:hypothetical protein [Mesorhizobium sp. GbtcB19]